MSHILYYQEWVYMQLFKTANTNAQNKTLSISTFDGKSYDKAQDLPDSLNLNTYREVNGAELKRAEQPGSVW